MNLPSPPIQEALLEVNEDSFYHRVQMTAQKPLSTMENSYNTAYTNSLSTKTYGTASTALFAKTLSGLWTELYVNHTYYKSFFLQLQNISA